MVLWGAAVPKISRLFLDSGIYVLNRTFVANLNFQGGHLCFCEPETQSKEMGGLRGQRDFHGTYGCCDNLNHNKNSFSLNKESKIKKIFNSYDFILNGSGLFA
ncbi:hypothetical protein M5D96_011089, partial [Drosophila gunungcola]